MSEEITESGSETLNRIGYAGVENYIDAAFNDVKIKQNEIRETVKRFRKDREWFAEKHGIKPIKTEPEYEMLTVEEIERDLMNGKPVTVPVMDEDGYAAHLKSLLERVGSNGSLDVMKPYIGNVLVKASQDGHGALSNEYREMFNKSNGTTF